MKIVLLGPPGSGKGTQAQLLANRDGWTWFSTGDILRHELKRDSERARSVRGHVETGGLVPDEIILELARDFLAGHRDGNIVFDGFPRTPGQAAGLDLLLGGRLDWAVFIELTEAQVIERLTGRWVCGRCGETFNTAVHPPREQGICDRCRDKLVLRLDDAPDVIKARFALYRQLRDQLYDYYARQSIVRTVDGTGSIEDIHARITAVWGSS